MVKTKEQFKMKIRLPFQIYKKVGVLIFLFYVIPVNIVYAYVSFDWSRDPTWNSNIGTGRIGGDCTLSSGSGAKTANCNTQLNNNQGKTLVPRCWAQTTDGKDIKELLLTETTNYNGWDIKFHVEGIPVTDTLLKDIYNNSGQNYEGRDDYFIDVDAAYSQGTAIKPVKLYCSLDNAGSIVSYNGLNLTFTPPVSAAFSVKTNVTNIKHRTSETGVHKYTLDFGKTIFNTKRQLKISDYNCSDLNSVNAKLSYTKANGQTLSNAELKTDGTVFYLDVDNPSSATLEIYAKKNSPGMYSCSMTLSQTVE